MGRGGVFTPDPKRTSRYMWKESIVHGYIYEQRETTGLFRPMDGCGEQGFRRPVGPVGGRLKTFRPTLSSYKYAFPSPYKALPAFNKNYYFLERIREPANVPLDTGRDEVNAITPLSPFTPTTRFWTFPAPYSIHGAHETLSRPRNDPL